MASGYSQQPIIHASHRKNQSKARVGRLIRGSISSQASRKQRIKSYSYAFPSKPTTLEIECLPKTRANLTRHTRRVITTTIPTRQKDQIVLIDSSIYPSIFYRKITLRNVLKEFVFPDNVKALPPNDSRSGLIFQIASNVFKQINLFSFNIYAGENTLTNSFYIFFSDTEVTPYSKCCNAPVYVELINNGCGRILCNSNKCKSPHLAEFLINFDDGKKIWKNLKYFAQAQDKDKALRNKISRFINNGKYKKVNLIQVVEQTSKSIVKLFCNEKKKENTQPQITIEDDEQFANPFLTTDCQQNRYLKTAPAETLEEKLQSNFLQNEFGEFSDINISITTNDIMSKTYSGLQTKLSEGLVREGKVFHKDFSLINKIDSHILSRKRRKDTTNLNFPRIMSEFHRSRRTAQNQARSNVFNTKSTINHLTL